MIEDDVQLILKQYNSKFIKYKISPGAYKFKDLSEVLSRGFEDDFEITGRMRPNHEYDKSDSIIIDSGNVSLITKLKLSPRIHALSFDKKSFSNTIIAFTPYCDYKNYDNEYYSEKKNKNLSTIYKIQVKSDCIASSVLNVVRQPILYSFVLE